MSYNPQKHHNIDGMLVPVCPYCQVRTKLNFNSFGAHWACPVQNCGARVGVHRDSKRYAPLGFPARGYLRAARMSCHNLFDPLWRGYPRRFSSRLAAYEWLANALGVPVKRCHFAEFDVDTCKRAEAAILTLKESTHEDPIPR